MNEDQVIRRPARGPRVGVAQLAPALGDVEANLRMHREAVARARDQGVDLLVFPELGLTGYRLKDTVPDVAAKRGDAVFAELASLSADLSIVVGLVEESPEHAFYNAAVLFEGGGVTAVHRKVYLPTYGMFDEQRYFARGRRIAATDSRHGRLATLICEDMLHPTAVTIAALDGASLILVPSSSPARGIAGEGEVDANGRHWEAYNRVLARNTGVYVVYANRVGVEDGQTFWGGSEIIGPQGETLAKAAYYDEDFISAVLPQDAVRRRRIQYPVLRDEDLDLTINELMRIRQRPRERSGQARREGRDRGAEDRRKDRRRDDRRREGRGRSSDRGDNADASGSVPPRYRPAADERKRRSVHPGEAVADPPREDE
ncbi:MAG: carbon-nitrogen hydrolase [Deltaproteobacteria bacterium]|nr:MAG: carbon-nitrogen hydrolase [Deltaproteobacteria bacterium]